MANTLPPDYRPRRTAAGRSRDSQFVVRREPTKVYNYMGDIDKDKGKKKGSSSGLDFFVAAGKVILLLMCGLATAFLLFESYPKNSVHILAWVSLVPFLLGLRMVKTLSGSFLYSFASGIIINSFIFYWIFYTCQAGGVETGLALLMTAGLVAVVSIQFAVFGMCTFAVQRFKWVYVPLVACTWAGIEWLHSFIAYKAVGFSWFLLGYSQWNAPEIIQIAAYGGVFLVSFVIAAVNASAAAVFTSKTFPERTLNFFIGSAVLCLVFLFGRESLQNSKESEYKDVIRFAVLQPNIDQYKKWNDAFIDEIENKLLEQTEKAAMSNPGIIVWPESALPGSIEMPEYKELVEYIAMKSNSWQLLGTDRMATGDKHYVSAYFVSPDAKTEGIYDKRQLVPFGEYIPFESYIRSMNLNIDVLGALGAFIPGSNLQAPFEYNGIVFAPNICYESLFPALWREDSRVGARFFVNMTNDGWYLDTSAPYQHFAVNVLRAVETGKPVIRSANTGISGWIDGKGRVKDRSELGAEGVFIYDVPVPQEGVQTFYSNFGDIFAMAFCVIFMTATCIGIVFMYE
ncbi:apolipoprotein N-acyltransferase [Parelusimicrobium proximum]|uniref:apolipoprotein N-acyltransferase n=1 Tax=Parelusimicrobium proximum TaxID=3228953 RepID=UPI003D177078